MLMGVIGMETDLGQQPYRMGTLPSECKRYMETLLVAPRFLITFKSTVKLSREL